MQANHMHTCLDGHAFSSYITGSASELLKARVEKHLNLCSPCFAGFIEALNALLNRTTQTRKRTAAMPRVSPCA